MISIGFYGTGNMATAMAKGMKDLAKIYGFGKNTSKNKKFSANGTLVKNEEALFEKSDIIILAVKPQSLNEIKKIPVPCCSILAGVEIEKLKKICNGKIMRVMPSLSIEHTKGAILKTGDQLKGFDAILKKMGTVFEVNELHFHELSLIVGSMPALVALFLQCLQNSLTSPLSEEAKKKMILAAFEGVKIEEPFEDLIQRVASPGGITEQYLKIQSELQNLVSHGVQNAKKRSEELSRN